MRQHRRHSFLEACLNTAIGYTIALGTQLVVFPLFGIHIPLSANLTIGVIFTVVSVIRSYFIRRLFVELHARSIL